MDEFLFFFMNFFLYDELNQFHMQLKMHCLDNGSFEFIPYK